mmetsp:Transcript_5236/g.8099  ORF Transcript_5236/g.8099 Transcript_5236/m.8099 type:complete len:549 (-) Transcript_5236:260-1906(-)
MFRQLSFALFGSGDDARIIAVPHGEFQDDFPDDISMISLGASTVAHWGRALYKCCNCEDGKTEEEGTMCVKCTIIITNNNSNQDDAVTLEEVFPPFEAPSSDCEEDQDMPLLSSRTRALRGNRKTSFLGWATEEESNKMDKYLFEGQSPDPLADLPRKPSMKYTGVGDMPRKPSIRIGAPRRNRRESFGRWNAEDQKAWSCPSCTYVNEGALHLACEVCGSTKPSPAAAATTTTTGPNRGIGHFFDASFRFPQGQMVNEKNRLQVEAEQRAIERERMDELIKEQEHRLSQLRVEVETKPKQERTRDKKEVVVVKKFGSWAECLTKLERLHTEEQSEHNLVKNLQEKRLATLDDKRQSLKAMQWTGQQRLLQEWEKKLERRGSQIQLMKEQQKLMREALGLESSSSSSSKEKERSNETAPNKGQEEQRPGIVWERNSAPPTNRTIGEQQKVLRDALGLGHRNPGPTPPPQHQPPTPTQQQQESPPTPQQQGRPGESKENIEKKEQDVKRPGIVWEPNADRATSTSKSLKEQQKILRNALGLGTNQEETM